MANILLVDPDELAQRALRGILARGEHRLAAVATAAEARAFIDRNILIDLVVLELTLADDAPGLPLLHELRRDPLLHGLPVVVYAVSGDREAVRQALAAGVQNFLIKPYLDAHIFAEVAKAMAKPWRDALWVAEGLWAARKNIALTEVRRTREAFLEFLEHRAKALREDVRQERMDPVLEGLVELAEAGLAVGGSVLVTFLEGLQSLVEAQRWPAVADELSRLEHAQRWLHCGDRVEHAPEGFATEAERKVDEAKREAAQWLQAARADQLPALTWNHLVHAAESLGGCPIVDSVAASFQMAATGHPSSLSPLMDLAEKDPCLSAQLLIETNRLRGKDELADPVESGRLCIGLLGETKLCGLARQFVVTDNALLDHPPFSWSQYWMFQLGVAQLARHTCTYLEFESMEVRAYTAGLIHDLGRLLLLHLHPGGAMAIMDHAAHQEQPLRAVEKRFLGGTTRDLGAHFALQRGLPECFANVMRWVDTPELATADQELVAIVSLARDLCLHNRVGCSGESTTLESVPLDQTPQWAILGSRIYPSFNLRKFEVHIHAMCRDLKRELSGRSVATV